MIQLSSQAAIKKLLKTHKPAEIARALQCASAVSIYQWKSGRVKMSKPNAKKFQDLYEIYVYDAV